MSKHDYRAYCFTNALYMSQIQLGIQSAHAISEMFVRYPKNTPNGRKLLQWGKEDKTIIILNGGIVADLQSIQSELREIGEILELPWASFHEDLQSLGGVITAVSIVLPKEIYQAKQITPYFDPDGLWYYERDTGAHVDYTPDSTEARLLRLVKSCRLA